jgi:hypothetical protein
MSVPQKMHWGDTTKILTFRCTKYRENSNRNITLTYVTITEYYITSIAQQQDNLMKPRYLSTINTSVIHNPASDKKNVTNKFTCLSTGQVCKTDFQLLSYYCQRTKLCSIAPTSSIP